MDKTKVKYLDELIFAIKSSETDNFSITEAGNYQLDDRTNKAYQTLLRNINDETASDCVFQKSLEALALLLKTNTLLINGTVDGISMVQYVLNDMVMCSITYWSNLQRSWLVRRMAQRWLTVYSFSLSSETALWVSNKIDHFERQLMLCLMGKLDYKELFSAFKETIIVCEWITSSHVNFLENIKKWDVQFQRLIRLTIYVMSSINLRTIELSTVVSRLLNLLTFYGSMGNPSLLRFAFASEIVQSLCVTQKSLVPSLSISKALLRLLYLSFGHLSLFLHLRKTFTLKEQLRSFDKSDLVFEVVNYITLRLSDPETKEDHTFDNKQVQELYLKINAILPNTSYDSDCSHFQESFDSNVSFEKIKVLLSNAKKSSDFQELVKLTIPLAQLAFQDSGQSHYSLAVCSLRNTAVRFGGKKTRLPIQKCSAFKLLSHYYLSDDAIQNSSDSMRAGILLCLISIFSHYQPPILQKDCKDDTQEGFFLRLLEYAYNSRSRFMRLLVTRLLGLLVKTDDGVEEDQNTKFLIKFLQKPKSGYMLETCHMSWVNLVLNCDDDYFDDLLLKLLDLFNSTDFAEHTMMASQLRHIARMQNKSVYQLLSPILPVLFKKIGKNLVDKKLEFQRVVEIVDYPAKTLLENFQRYVIPYAIGQYKGDVLAEVARLMSGNDEALIEKQKSLLLDRNSRQIFAVALVKHGFFSIDTIETLFLNAAPNFRKAYIARYLPDYKTLAEVLKMSKPISSLEPRLSETEKSVLASLRYLVLTNFTSDRRRGTRFKNLDDWSTEMESEFQRKIQESILGIFQVFSNDMQDSDGKTSYYEKLRVLNGITFLMKHASKKCIISVLAQLSICLQTGSEISEILLNTLQCWHLLVKLLNEEQLVAIIDDLFCFILQKWHSFNRSCKSECHSLFDTLLKERSKLVLNSHPFILLSFLQNPELEVLERHPVAARNVNKVLGTTNWLSAFAQNLRSNNKYVVFQTLLELEKYFSDSLFRKNMDVVTRHKDSHFLSILLAALLDTSHKFRNKNRKISQYAVSCMSLIGLLDVTKHSLPRTNRETQDICDFNNHSQTVKFLNNIINDILVPSFWQSENPTKQLFVALVMQESLKYCGLSSSNWDINNPEKHPVESKLWSRFSDISKTTLYPLLSSLYLAQSWKEYVPLSYPSFKVKDGYQVWIRNLTLDLLKTGTTEEHPLHVFSSLIREDDGYLSNFLLPYITMDIIIRANGNNFYSQISKNLLVEFEFVFKFELQHLNHFQIDSLKMAYNSIFGVYEYCKKWISRFKQDYQAANGTYMIHEEKLSRLLERTEHFINSIPSDVLARKSLETNSFERSALYLEQSFRDQGTSSFESGNLLSCLQTTYSEIGDFDAVDGALRMFSSGNLTAKIEELQYSKNWKMAQDCFEALGDTSNLIPVVNKELTDLSNLKMLKSMYNHQLFGDILTKLDILFPEPRRILDENYKDFLNMGLESAIQKGNVLALTKWIHKVENVQDISDPSLLLHYNIAKALQSVTRGSDQQMESYINKCFKLIGTRFTTPSSSTTLVKKREILEKLHALTDMKSIVSCDTENSFKNCMNSLDGRLSHVGSDFAPRHYLLSVRKATELLSTKPFIKEDISNVYFRLSQLDRKNDRLDIAAEELMNALKYNHHAAELEFAEILWKQGEKDMALKMVAEISTTFEQQKTHRAGKNQDYKKVLLKYTEWLDLSNSSVSEQIIKQYNDLIRYDKDWDAPFYSMGLYYSKLLEKKKIEGYLTDGSLEYQSISNFLISFEKGSQNIRQSLPKVVTLWLDTAEAAAKNSLGSATSQRGDISSKICNKVDAAVKNCGVHIWYTVLTQLLSRLLHPHVNTLHSIVGILFHMTLQYPSVMLWYIAILLNSEDSARRNIGKQIIDAFLQKSSKSKLPSVAVALVQQLTRICIKDVKTAVSRSGRTIDTDFRFNLDLAPNEMCVPVNVNLKKLLPSTSRDMNSDLFKSQMVTISKFSSQYMVFSSLKKPKKISMIGSDGNAYGIMCKKEDVRQDNQYMQFANTMGFLLAGDAESVKRNLGITTYGVLSLREDCGLLEIVPNVLTMRSILTMKYESMKIRYSLKTLQEKWQATSADQKLAFHKDCLRKFPPVLYQWFLDNFPDPISWYNSRNNFVRSYAVMGMVGHILGLGDRHCENILLDIGTGGVLHVDFDCLFEKGKKLPVPEIVPFRLTQNIKDAFGIIGTEGTFKKTSEVTIRVMRDNEVGLANIIETIMYDRKMDDSIQMALKVLRDKIRGIDSRDGLTLSVSGQVETLTQEAVSDDNLSKMYIGWLPFW